MNPASTTPNDNLRASLFMMASMAGFVVNDTFVKLASSEMSTAQIMALRGIMASLLLLILAWSRGAMRPLSVAVTPIVMLRTGADVAGTLSYITALANIPLANASAIYQALPLTVTLGAALFLREPVGWRRWTATGIGFVGVLIIVRPGTEGFTVYSLAVLASVVFSAVRDLATRRMDRHIPSLFVSLVTAIAVTVAGALLVPFSGGWSPVTTTTFGFLACAAGTITFGYIFIVGAMRIGDMGVVAQFRYSILLFALVIGFIIFGEIPDAATILGSAIVVASGAYTLYRERTRGRLKVAKAQVH